LRIFAVLAVEALLNGKFSRYRFWLHLAAFSFLTNVRGPQASLVVFFFNLAVKVAN
jgi:hypothetical protein